MTSRCPPIAFFFFFNDTATTEIYTLSLHDALPISVGSGLALGRLLLLDPHERSLARFEIPGTRARISKRARLRSEEHTSELQSHSDLVCRLLLEKKKTTRSIQRRAGGIR